MRANTTGCCLLALLAALLLMPGCTGDQTRAVSVVGSTSVQPFAELLAEEYVTKHPRAGVDVQGGGSTAGLQAVANGLADIGMCSRSLSPTEAEEFSGTIIARDGLAIVVNPANPVRELTTPQLRGLFTGSIDNWRAVGGQDMPVRPITREEGSGTRESFVHLVMGKERISRRALTQESNGAVKELVKGDRAAIGYMSLGLVGEELKSVQVDGVDPTSANVLAGTYKLARPFLFVTRGPIGPDAQRFFDYVLSSDSQRTLETEGLVRAQ
ncbi:MAG TPA: phosphate ABC transporter substrate-binding protein [Candidatus Hydrogenedentes bacterium]|nr:phosphate ABC transporter substrate-binding protein [Candidatus Hydrogenedentota bacterium]HPG66948.1 phosphate ABC transporter substrate-binding protein [Candidatus Hydrogenedentota bacterium]